MAEPFSTNELFLRSDRIAFGKTPPEVPELTEQTLILPDLTGSKLYFGLSSLVSTSGFSGTLEAIYPNYASFTFDNLNSRLGINVSTPQYSIDISTTTGVRILGGSLVANAQGLVSVPTASLFSTLPSYVFAPGTIPVTAIVSTGGSVLPGISVPTSALFSTLPTSLFAPSSIPLVALQSSGIIVASSFVGDGFYLSNIPLANINGTITGDFFRPNSIPLSTLASTGQIWIRNPEGSIITPYLSTAQLLTSSLVARNVSTVNLTTNRFIASSIQANYFESGTFAASNISAINIKASSLEVLCRISAGTFFGDGKNITNLTPAFLNNVIPSDKFGYRLIGINAINPYGDWQWIAGTFTLQQAAPLVSYGDIQASSFHGGVYFGDGRGLYNLNSISTASLVSTVRGLGTVGYVSSLSLTSSLIGLGTMNYVSTPSLVSTVQGLSQVGYISSGHLISTLDGLGTLGYVSSTQLASTVAGLATANYVSSTQLMSTLTGLATLGYVSSTQLQSTVEGLASANYISSTQLNSTLTGLATLGFISTTQLVSTVTSLQNQNNSTSAGNTSELVSSLTGLASLGYISSTQLNSTLQGLSQIGYVSTTQLTSTVFSLETQNYSTSAGNTQELLSSLTGLGSLGYISTSQLNSTLTGLATLGYISTTQLTSTVFSLQNQNNSTSAGNTSELLSSLTGLGSLGYISSTQLNSTLQGLSQIGYVSTTQLTSTVFSLQNQNNSTSAGNTSELLSSLTGLGSLGYISSAQLISTVGGLEFYISSFIDPTELASTITSTVIGIGLESNLKSTVTGLGSAGYVSTLSLVSTTFGLQQYISSFIDPIELASSILPFISSSYFTTQLVSTVEGLGSAGYVSSSQLISSIDGILTSGIIKPVDLTSSIIGLGTVGYVSTLSLVSTTLGLQTYISSFIDPTELASTITSTVLGIGIEPNLQSTVTGLGSAGYVSSLSLVSTTFGLQQYISSFIDPIELASSILPFISSTYFTTSLTSTVTGLGSAGYVSTLSMYSAINTAISSLSTAYGFVGSLATIPSTVSTFSLLTSSLTASTIQTRTISSLDLWVSSINGAAPGSGSLTSIPSTLSTFAILTSSLMTSTLTAKIERSESSITSTLVITGTGIAKWNGTNSASLYGSGVDTFTLQTSCNAYTGGIASLAFATSTMGYPLGRIYALDSAVSGSPISQMIFQTVPISPTSFNSNYSYTGANQTFTVPAGVTSMQVSLWGAGGAAANYGSYGGAGAFVQGTLSVTPGQVYTIVVGQGGIASSGSTSYGGGGSGGGNGSTSGGGRSAILLNLTVTVSSASGSGSAITYTTSGNHGLLINQPVIISGLSPSGFNGNFVISSTPAGNQFVVSSGQTGSSTGTGTILGEVVDVGGGGGCGQNGSYSVSSGGAATYSGTAFDGKGGWSGQTNAGGKGGKQNGGGAGGSGTTFGTGSTGSILQGGNGVNFSGGGGGGYYGGGGAGDVGGGGGGSSYTSHTSFALTLGLNSPNSQEQAPGTSIPGYVSGVAAGGTSGTGGNGYVILNSIGGSITEAMRIGSNSYLGIGTTTPSYLLDVAGNARMSNVYLGTNSTLITQQFYGLFGNYNNTVLAEISTGGGTQELLVFRGSSASDRVRVQTTGTFVVETGVSSRLWSTNTMITASNATPAFIINTSSNVGIQTASPGATLDVAGTGRFQTLSTLQILASSILTPFISTQALWVSTINGVVPGVFNGSTTSLSSATIFTSTLSTVQLFAGTAITTSSLTSTSIVNGTEIVKWNGTNSASLYGLGIDTLTLQTSCNANQAGIASLAFATNTASYPLGRIYALDTAISGSPISQLIFQNVPISATSFNSNYSYTGSAQTFTVPTGVTTMQVTLWGAGGGSPNAGSNAGAGAFVQGVLNVTPGQVYTIVTGQGGGIGTYPTNSYGGGGWGFGGTGGGRSAIQLNLTVTITTATGSSGTVTYTTSGAHGLQLNQPVIISGLSPSGFNGNYVVASIPATNQFVVSSSQTGSSTGTGSILGEIVNAGGGGGGGQGGRGGYATFSGTAASGPVGGGGGGSQTAGGGTGGGNSSAGTLFQGGNSAFSTTGGGAGGGYYGGGGGGGNPGATGTGGGGGSSYTSHTAFALSLGLNSPNSQNQAPGTSIAGYVSGVAAGASTNASGGNGLVLIASIGGSITEAMRIGSNGYLGIGTTSPSYTLDVAGNARMSNVYLGTNSTLITQQFYGLFGNYNNTVLAEISTGGGSQELLVFRGSSASDRVRVQTTGAFVVETGVSARLWSTNTAITASNVTPALVVTTSSNVGIQTANPGATLDVAGTGRFQILSTQQLLASTIQAPFMSTQQLFAGTAVTTSSLTSTLIVNGTELVKWNGTGSASLYGLGIDTLTLQTSSNAYQGGIASLAFGVSNTGYPLGRIYTLDSAVSGSPISQMIFQTVPISATSFTSNYSYTGSGQTFTVPAGVTTIQVSLWGAGGAATPYVAVGGAGAFVQGTLSVTPGQVYTIVVGQGGPISAGTIYGGGGTGSSTGWYAAGGGRSAIQLNVTATISSASGSGSAITYTTNTNHGLITGQPVVISGLSPSGFNGNFIVASTPSGTQFTVVSSQTGSSSGTGSILAEVVDAGGGGAGGYTNANSTGAGGYATYSGSGSGGYVKGTTGGGGGTQSSGGIAGVGASGNGSAGSALQGGGNAGPYAGGGGGGYYGGGSGGNDGVSSTGGGGGGSSYTSYTGFTLTLGYNSPNLQDTAPGQSVPGYVTGVAKGGSASAGGNGLVLITSIGGSITEAMRIGSNAYVGIGTTTPQTTLDVAGTGRFQVVSTQQAFASTLQVPYISSLSLWVCTINGAPPGSGSGGITSLPSTISTFSLLTSSIQASTISTIFLIASSITTSNINASTGLISSFSTNTINFAGGFGYLLMPDIFPNTVYTSTVTTSNLLVGVNSNVSPIQFFGFGTYSNSVIAELSTGGTTQELVMFRGSNASDRIRFQTTGSLVFEPGVSARLWPTVPSNVTPAMIINTSSNIGIQNAAPTVPLDVTGQIRATSFSTQQIATSSILGPARLQGATITSSFFMLGPSTFQLGAFSTSFMTAGVPEIDFFTNGIQRMTILSNGFVGIGITNPAYLLDVAGTGEFSTILTSSLTSWVTMSTVQMGASSIVTNNSRSIQASTLQMGASTFTGKWNDAQYYVLQTI